MDLLKKYSVKSPHFLWEWHFHSLLCEEMIFPLPSGKIMTSYLSQCFFPFGSGITFLFTKRCGNVLFIDRKKALKGVLHMFFFNQIIL